MDMLGMANLKVMGVTPEDRLFVALLRVDSGNLGLRSVRVSASSVGARAALVYAATQGGTEAVRPVLGGCKG